MLADSLRDDAASQMVLGFKCVALLRWLVRAAYYFLVGSSVEKKRREEQFFLVKPKKKRERVEE